MRIACISDLHGSLRGMERLAEAEVELLIVCGDITDFGGRAEAERLLRRLMEAAPRVLAVHGNCDSEGVPEALEALGVSLHGRGVRLGEVGFFGAGGSSKTPFNTPSELPEEEIAGLLERGYRMVSACSTLVLVSHSPPRGVADLTASGVHAGSEAVRAFVEAREPEFVVCGHIHEAKGCYSLGRSRVVNPGRLSSGLAVIDVAARRAELI